MKVVSTVTLSLMKVVSTVTLSLRFVTIIFCLLAGFTTLVCKGARLIGKPTWTAIRVYLENKETFDSLSEKSKVVLDKSGEVLANFADSTLDKYCESMPHRLRPPCINRSSKSAKTKQPINNEMISALYFINFCRNADNQNHPSCRDKTDPPLLLLKNVNLKKQQQALFPTLSADLESIDQIK